MSAGVEFSPTATLACYWQDVPVVESEPPSPLLSMRVLGVYLLDAPGLQSPRMFTPNTAAFMHAENTVPSGG